MGELLERVLGATGGSAATWDFPELAIELKTIPVDARGVPSESTFVCAVSLLDAERAEWETSWARAKLGRVLWVPVTGDVGSERRVGSARLLGAVGRARGDLARGLRRDLRTHRRFGNRRHLGAGRPVAPAPPEGGSTGASAPARRAATRATCRRRSRAASICAPGSPAPSCAIRSRSRPRRNADRLASAWAWSGEWPQRAQRAQRLGGRAGACGTFVEPVHLDVSRCRAARRGIMVVKNGKRVPDTGEGARARALQPHPNLCALCALCG